MLGGTLGARRGVDIKATDLGCSGRLRARRLAGRCAALASVSPLAAVSAWVRERPTKRAQRGAWNRYRVAGEVRDDARQEFRSAPSPVTADQLRCAEIAYVDAIAIAGEFES